MSADDTPPVSETEVERVRRLASSALRSWLVTNDATGSPLVPVQWLRDGLYALREDYPGDGRTGRALAYRAALGDVHALLDRAEAVQRLDESGHPNGDEA